MPKTKPKWTDNATQEAVRAVKEKILSVHRAARAINVLFSCLQKIIQGIKMNKC
jgi:transposase-like protein